MSHVALLALEFGDANVVVTSLVLVFGMLVALASRIAKKEAPAATGCAACPMASSCNRLPEKGGRDA